LKFYNSKSHDFLIGHFPGETRHIYNELINEFKNIKFKPNKAVTIISPITKDYLSISPLHQQLILNECKYINTIADRTMYWKKIDKIDAIIDHGDTVLIKGSHGMKLIEVVEHLKNV